MNKYPWKPGMGIALLLVGFTALGMSGKSRAAQPQGAINTALIEAVKRGDTAAARVFLDQGADPNAKEVVLTKPSLAEGARGGKPVSENTALIIAVQKRNAELV